MTEERSIPHQPNASAVPDEQYSIVIAGNHDPRQHHPFWYHLIGVLSDAQRDFALSSAFVVPGFATFNAGEFAVLCESNRWQIATTTFENQERIRAITTTVFDQKLFQVSVTAVGANCLFNAHTCATKVGLIVARAIEAGGLVPAIEGKTDGSAVVIGRDSDRMVRAEVGESVTGPSWASIAHNVHRDVPKTSNYYAIAGVLQHCESDWRHGRRFGDEVVKRINALSGK